MIPVMRRVIDQRKTKNEAEYRATPKARMRCEVCPHFVQPDACKKVKGPITPQGWCNQYQKRAQT